VELYLLSPYVFMAWCLANHRAITRNITEMEVKDLRKQRCPSLFFVVDLLAPSSENPTLSVAARDLNTPLAACN